MNIVYLNGLKIQELTQSAGITRVSNNANNEYLSQMVERMTQMKHYNNNNNSNNHNNNDNNNIDSNNNRFDFCNDIGTRLTDIPENEEIDSRNDNKSDNDNGNDNDGCYNP